MVLYSLKRGRLDELLSVCSKSVAEPDLALRLLWARTVEPFSESQKEPHALDFGRRASRT